MRASTSTASTQMLKARRQTQRNSLAASLFGKRDLSYTIRLVAALNQQAARFFYLSSHYSIFKN
jgi:hypothetical protein